MTGQRDKPLTVPASLIRFGVWPSSGAGTLKNITILNADRIILAFKSFQKSSPKMSKPEYI